ncbi:hypothetical protein CK203_043592 [Vitis vinifera]|uniref:Uncharacterized protein n=1 Tax=Vitis vinifera TaxID=29760 RepID=A0A438HYG2_VITVI|nr:hypothetical protein CK203_043592 [Vitis vinifera]
MSTNKETTSSSSSGDANAEKSLDKLNVREFRERFYILNGVLVELMNGEVMTTEKSDDNISPAYIHPNMVRMLMGCNILSMLFNLDLSLLEVLFVYSLKKGKNDIFSMVAHLPSLQLVTELLDSTKGGAKEHVLVRGAWAGLLEHPKRSFSPNRSLVLPGSDKRGRVVEWVEKASFARLNKLFEITAAKRHHETLLTARNLLAVVQEPQAYVINILPRKLPKKVVSREHYVLKDLPSYKEVHKVDAQKRQARLDDREGKRKEGTLRRAPGKKRFAPSLPVGATSKKKKKLVLNKGK